MARSRCGRATGGVKQLGWLCADISRMATRASHSSSGSTTIAIVCSCSAASGLLGNRTLQWMDGSREPVHFYFFSDKELRHK